ncbi:MAG: phage tail protein [Oscillochloris sp.]|nr:phage tail protein [Oscillochloris sp.]
MALDDRNDPLPAFNFVVQLLESSGGRRTVAGFSECGGLDSTLEVQEYQEGGVNDRVRKFPSRFSFSNITLKRGISTNPTLREWHLNLLRGISDRRDGLIILLNERREPVLAWKFERGLPIKWSGPTLNAGTSEVAIETLEIAHEHLEEVPV